MSDRKPFRIGITPDFETVMKGIIDPGVEQILKPASGIEWEFMPDTGGVADPKVLNNYDAAIVLDYRFTADSFTGAERLAIIARWGVGFDRIDVPACTEASVILAVTPDSVARPVAEGAIGLMFALCKNFRPHDINIRAGRWREGAPIGSGIQGKTLGIVGLGNIGRELFRIARGVGFGRLLAYEPIAPSAEEAAMGVKFVDLDSVLRESDFVSIHCPLNEQTRGMIGAPQFELMKPTAFLINTARGPIVDEAALVAALTNHTIAGAAIDVFATEPIRPDNPLLKMENAIFSPHVIARTQEGIRDTSISACRSVVSVSKGVAPPYIVNRKVLDQAAMQAKLARYR